jgi:uncharacterized membrane protein YgcG
MTKPRWLVGIPIGVATLLIATSTWGASIRDSAHMFSKEAVTKAKANLDRIEQASHIPIVIETIEALPDGGSPAVKKRAINELAVKRDKAIRDEGLYLLISRDDHLISNVLVRERLADLVSVGKRDAIREAFIGPFHQRDFDGGLLKGTEAIASALEGASVGHRVAHAPAALPLAGRPRGGQSTMGTFLLIIVGIFGVLLAAARGIGRPICRGRLSRPDGRHGYASAGHGPWGAGSLWRGRLRWPGWRILFRDARWARWGPRGQLALRSIFGSARRLQWR